MTDMHREAFERHFGLSKEQIETMPMSEGARMHLRIAYARDFDTWQAAIRHMREQNEKRNSHE